MAVTGVILAAGAGTRAGGPKVLRPGWLSESCATLLDGGCSHVIVVLGAAPDAPIPVDARITSVTAADWADGMSRSLRAGLGAATEEAAVVTLVDLPGMPASVVQRVLAADGPLRQATYGGRPGHPVYMESAHWGLPLSGDRGARDYLAAHAATLVECGDLWHGRDVDL